MSEEKTLEGELEINKDELDKLASIFMNHGYGVKDIEGKRNLLLKYHNHIKIQKNEKEREQNIMQQMKNANADGIENNENEIEKLKSDIEEMEKVLENPDLPSTLRIGTTNKIEYNKSRIATIDEKNNALIERNTYLIANIEAIPAELEGYDSSMKVIEKEKALLEALLGNDEYCKELEEKKKELSDFVQKHNIEWKREDNIPELYEMFPMLKGAETIEQQNTTKHLKAGITILHFNEEVVCDKFLSEDGVIRQTISTKDVKSLGVIETKDDKIINVDMEFPEGGYVETAAGLEINIRRGKKITMESRGKGEIDFTMYKNGKFVRDYIFDAEGKVYKKKRLMIGRLNAHNRSFDREYWF